MYIWRAGYCRHCVGTIFLLSLCNWSCSLRENVRLIISKFQVKCIYIAFLNIHILFLNLQFPWVPFKKSLLHPARRSKQAKELVQSAVTIGLIPSNLAKLHWFPVTYAQEVSFYEASVNYRNFISGYFGNDFMWHLLQFYLAGFAKSFCRICALKLAGNSRVILYSRTKQFSNLKYIFYSQKILMNVLAEFTIVSMAQLIA